MPSGSYSDGTTNPTVVTPFGKLNQGASQDHCPSAGAVGAASPGTCTLLDPAMLATNVDLTAHGYVKDAAAVPADTGKGAVMTLSQAECYSATTGVNNPNCCQTSTLKNGQKTQVCASWAGTHISSNFGVQYGVLETEAAFNLTVNGGAYVFFGSYMYGGKIPTGATAVDQSWCALLQLASRRRVPDPPCAVQERDRRARVQPKHRRRDRGACSRIHRALDETLTMRVTRSTPTAPRCSCPSPRPRPPASRTATAPTAPPAWCVPIYVCFECAQSKEPPSSPRIMDLHGYKESTRNQYSTLTPLPPFLRSSRIMIRPASACSTRCARPPSAPQARATVATCAARRASTARRTST